MGTNDMQNWNWNCELMLVGVTNLLNVARLHYIWIYCFGRCDFVVCCMPHVAGDSCWMTLGYRFFGTGAAVQCSVLFFFFFCFRNLLYVSWAIVLSFLFLSIWIKSLFPKRLDRICFLNWNQFANPRLDLMFQNPRPDLMFQTLDQIRSSKP